MIRLSVVGISIVVVGGFIYLFSSYIDHMGPQSATKNSQHRLCNDYLGVPESRENAVGGIPVGMVWVPQGEFIMGNDGGHRSEEDGRFDPLPEERGEAKKRVKGFWIDIHEVTNAQYAHFVEETGYVTIAERVPPASWFPEGFPDDERKPGSAVFIAAHSSGQWWHFVEGANWREPEGPGSSINDRMNHPVVHVAYPDALAYAQWLGRELPTEAQWEYAAKGKLQNALYTWGNDYKINGQWMANTWQGDFPAQNTLEDGYVGTAPVGCYAPNSIDIFDITGNVWEIVSSHYLLGNRKNVAPNLLEETNLESLPATLGRHVIKGGSFLCSPSYCMRYRAPARQPQEFTMGSSHVGFRTVLNAGE